ncbi:MAG: 50S ribosomal protein L19 [Candidatus Hydrogenedentes bacterium CG07_land_8_20_14_0_80_42_17]|nr:MAG: 50S ribosomal protein L19 [Candidatus Hydrogenedentes bacterium CG07_land_8_20_14_0_80_42_17]
MKLSIPEIEKGYMKENIPAFRTGDTVRVHTKVKEGNRERIQMFEGIVIHRKNSGLKETFTVRKVSFGIGVERIFPLHSPLVEKIEVIRSGKVKKSRIFYMRDRSGKKSRLKEREDYKNGDKQIASAE